MAKKPIKSLQEAKAIVALGKGYTKLNRLEKTKINEELCRKLTEIEKKLLSLGSIDQLKAGWDELDLILVHHGNTEGMQMVAACREKALARLYELGLTYPLPASPAESKEIWLKAKPEIQKLKLKMIEEQKVIHKQQVYNEWLETYELDNGISYEDARKIALTDGWSKETQIIREVLIDNRIWEQILERMPPRSQQYARERFRTNTGIAQIGIRRGKYFVELDLTPKKSYEVTMRLFGLNEEHGASLKKAAMEAMVLRGYMPRDVRHNKQAVIQEDIDEGNSESGFIYFIRNQGLYKIGITTNLLRRFNELRPDEVLNVVRCANYQEAEKDLHRMFSEKRVTQTEYFRLDEREISLVHRFSQEKTVYS